MSLSISTLNNILALAASSPAEAKALLKLTSMEILKNLGQGNYLIRVNGEELNAQSDQKLQPSARYWAELSATPNSHTRITHPLKQPLLLQSLSALPFKMGPEQIIGLLQGKAPHKTLHKMLLEPMVHAGSKEEFSALTQLMLSLQHNVLTLPLYYAHYVGFLQWKKRYNAQTKKTNIDFYATLHHLGPIEGSITLFEGEIFITVGVAYESTLSHLNNHTDLLKYTVHLTRKPENTIEPLWHNEGTTLLDVSI